MVTVTCPACGTKHTLDVYHPLTSQDHEMTCAGLCTNEAGAGCEMDHHCWCPDGALSYADFQARHPDLEIIE